MSCRICIIVALAALGALAGILAPVSADASSEPSDRPPVFRRALALVAGQPVVLSTNYGNVEVLEASGDQLEIVVHRRRHDDLYLEIENHDGALHIRSHFGIEPPPGPPSAWDVGYELHVPRGTKYEIQTGDGRVLGG